MFSVLIAPNSIFAGAVPQTPLWELTAIFQILSWNLGLQYVLGERTGEGRGKGERVEGRGGEEKGGRSGKKGRKGGKVFQFKFLATPLW